MNTDTRFEFASLRGMVSQTADGLEALDDLLGAHPEARELTAPLAVLALLQRHVEEIERRIDFELERRQRVAVIRQRVRDGVATQQELSELVWLDGVEETIEMSGPAPRREEA